MYRKKTHGFTMIEMIVVVAVLSILAVIIVPVVSASRKEARKTQCQAQLRRLGLAFHLYASMNDQYFPHEDDGDGWPPYHQCWFDLLDPHLGVKNLSQVKQCPTFSGDKEFHSYKMNSRLEVGDNHFYRLGSSPEESRTVLLFDARTDSKGVQWQTKGTPKSAEKRHDDGTNLLFVDGSVQYHEPEWDPKGGWADKGPFIWEWE